MVSQRRQFSAEFKLEAVRLAESGKSPSAVARQLGVRADLLRKWRQQLRGAARATDAGPGHRTVTSQDEEIRQLRREVAQLKEEREILKKATAFFARDSR